MRAGGFRVRADAMLALGLAAVALALRLHGLGDKPFWYDEILTFKRANLPLTDLFAESLANKHYPTYFLLVKLFASTVIDEWTLRLPSAVFGAAGVLLITLIASDVGGLRAASVAGLLMALSPFEVQFGQEARSYTLLTCLVLLALWGLIRIAQNPRDAALPLHRCGAQRGAWAAYTIGTLGAIYTQNSAVPWLLASNVVVLVLVFRVAAERGGLFRNWLWSQAIIIVLWLPAFVAMSLANKGAVLRGLTWVPKITWDNIWATMSAVYLFRVSDLMTFKLMSTLLPGFGFLVIALALLGIWRLRAEPVLLLTIGLAFLAMPITIAAVSAFHPMMVPRYLLWSTGPYFLLAGLGAVVLPARLFPLAAAVVAVGGALGLAPYYSAETKPRWDQVAAYLAVHARSGDIIMMESYYAELVLRAYGAQKGLDPKILILWWHPTGSVQRAAQAERTWAVYGRVGQGGQQPEDRFRQKWSALGAPAEQVRFGRHLLILRFDKAGRRAHVDLLGPAWPFWSWTGSWRTVTGHPLK
jgi:mannosyltransferase